MTVHSDLRAEYRNNLPPDATFDTVWNSYQHLPPQLNPFMPQSIYVAEWELRRARDQARRNADEMTRLQRWMQDYPKLKVEPRTGSKRRLEQTVLKLPFENLHDIRLRLDRTFIFIGSELYFVCEIREAPGSDFVLCVADENNKRFLILYSDPNIDLRTPEPQYITLNRAPVFLTRIPTRSQKQGINNENTIGYSVTPRTTIRPCDNLSQLIRGLRASNQTLSWSPHYDALLQSGMVPSLRLSKDVAVYLGDDGKTQIDFRTRTIGSLSEDTVKVNSRDVDRPWVVNALLNVGIQMRES